LELYDDRVLRLRDTQSRYPTARSYPDVVLC
jgi:hypothetical protein